MKSDRNVFETYGYHMSCGKRDGLVFPLSYAELLTPKGIMEGELAVAVMSDGERRLGFYVLDTDRFIDMQIKRDVDAPETLVIERDYKGKAVRLSEDDEIESIIGCEFEPSSQLAQYTNSHQSLTTMGIARHAKDLLEVAYYRGTLRKKGRDIPDKMMTGIEEGYRASALG